MYPYLLKTGFSTDNVPMVSFIGEDKILSYKIYISKKAIDGFCSFWQVDTVKTTRTIYANEKVYYPVIDMSYPYENITRKPINTYCSLIDIFYGVSFNTLKNQFYIDNEYFAALNKQKNGIIVKDFSKRNYCKIINIFGLGELNVELHNTINPYYKFGKVNIETLDDEKCFYNIYVGSFDDVKERIKSLEEYYKDFSKSFYLCALYNEKVTLVKNPNILTKI